MKADSVAAKVIKATRAARNCKWPKRTSSRMKGSSTPLRNRAKLRTNMEATVMVAGLVNPAKPSSGASTPATMNRVMMSTAVTSIVKYSLTNRKMPAAMIRSVR